MPICGALSDRLGRRKIFPIIGAIGMIVLFYPLLLLLNQPGFGVYVLVAASGWVVLGIWQAVYPTIQAELFPASVRVSGIGFAHQIVIAVFGGTAPLIAAAFVGAGHPMYVAIYMIVIVAALPHRLLHAPGDRQPGRARNRGSARPRGTGGRAPGLRHRACRGPDEALAVVGVLLLADESASSA